MFEKIIFWCEFPEKVNWKKLDRFLKESDYRITAYCAAQTKKDFFALKKKAGERIELKAWPILPKNEGYWFSGFISEKSIARLKDFKGLDVKIDLEPPLPRFDYSNIEVGLYALKFLFKKGKNNRLLENAINELKGNLIINEFPLPKFLLKRWGTFIESKKFTKNIMGYTTFAGNLPRPIIKACIKYFLKKQIKKNPNLMCSIGLIGPGVLKTEKTYNNIQEFKEDLTMAERIGIRKIAVYSLEAIMQKNNPTDWLNLLREFCKQG